jgi:hypothetical protein
VLRRRSETSIAGPRSAEQLLKTAAGVWRSRRVGCAGRPPCIRPCALQRALRQTRRGRAPRFQPSQDDGRLSFGCGRGKESVALGSCAAHIGMPLCAVLGSTRGTRSQFGHLTRLEPSVFRVGDTGRGKRIPHRTALPGSTDDVEARDRSGQSPLPPRAFARAKPPGVALTYHRQACEAPGQAPSPKPGTGQLARRLPPSSFLGEAVLMMELPRRYSTPSEGGPVRTAFKLTAPPGPANQDTPRLPVALRCQGRSEHSAQNTYPQTIDTPIARATGCQQRRADVGAPQPK